MTKEQSSTIKSKLTRLNWFALISTFFLASTAAINLFTARVNYQNRQDSKKFQEEEKQLRKLTLIPELQKQYYFLIFDLKKQVKNKELEPEDYYRRYWIDRAYEFMLFRNEFIDKNIYIPWVNSEKADYDLNEELNGKTYQKGYEYAKKFLVKRTPKESNTKEFFDFMDKVFQDDSTDSVPKAIDDLPKN